MSTPILATKLYIPPLRSKFIHRPRLIGRLNDGLNRKLTLISAAAGFGKTTLVSEWVTDCQRPAAWLSLDEEDNDLTRFLTYLVKALQTVGANIGAGMLQILQSPQPPPVELILSSLLNEIAADPQDFILVLDDYHLIDAQAVDKALAFLLEHLPPQMHLVIATREDPHLPLARLRARNQLSEVRITDLRFTLSEAAEFLKKVMGLDIAEEDIAALERRTEGWIAGLQLAAISMQGHQDVSSFIKSFTGSHHFVLDYLMEEVLQQQPENVQTFLLRTSILDRLCGPLCEVVMGSNDSSPGISGQEILEYIERTNLFIVPLDNERRWYRYHHLFKDLLRQRLGQNAGASQVCELQIRASKWHEDSGLDIEAFQYAAAANDVERAECLIEGKGVPLHFRGGMGPILAWLKSLPEAKMNARPSLWSTYASVLLGSGQTLGIEEKAQAAERALTALGREEDEENRDLIGRLASTRALLALSQQQEDKILTYGQRALEYLAPDNLSFRTSIMQTMAYAYVLQGERALAGRIYAEVQVATRASGATVTCIMASQGLGSIQELDNRLHEAAETYRYVLELTGDMPFPIIGEAYRGLARISYQWNDLEAAERYWEKSVPLSRQLTNTDRSVACEVFHARLMLARGDAAGAVEILVQAREEARRRNFIFQMPDISGTLVAALLYLGKLDEAAATAETSNLSLARVRVCLVRGESAEALTILKAFLQNVEARNWADERLKGLILKALALQAHDEKVAAVQGLCEALALAEPGGFIRIFIDEGQKMATLLREAAAEGIMPKYTGRLLAAFKAGEGGREGKPPTQDADGLIELLSDRELEVLRLIAEGKSNREIGEELFLALSTVKGHSQKIFDKLQVQRRTEAVARARELGVL
jgi:LuxR family transcriptional regulator, maltose regulon positive regulatory protein